MRKPDFESWAKDVALALADYTEEYADDKEPRFNMCYEHAMKALAEAYRLGREAALPSRALFAIAEGLFRCPTCHLPISHKTEDVTQTSNTSPVSHVVQSAPSDADVYDKYLEWVKSQAPHTLLTVSNADAYLAGYRAAQKDKI